LNAHRRRPFSETKFLETFNHSSAGCGISQLPLIQLGEVGRLNRRQAETIQSPHSLLHNRRRRIGESGSQLALTSGLDAGLFISAAFIFFATSMAALTESIFPIVIILGIPFGLNEFHVNSAHPFRTTLGYEAKLIACLRRLNPSLHAFTNVEEVIVAGDVGPDETEFTQPIFAGAGDPRSCAANSTP
jgi:hypothetical protein